MRANMYAIVSRAIEEGITFGVNRGFKHVEQDPPEALPEQLYTEIMNALCEVVDFDVAGNDEGG